METKNTPNAAKEESTDIFAVAEKQDEEIANAGLFTLHLMRPLEHEGKTYTELTFDFDALDGNDSLAIERELLTQGHTVIVANFDSEYLIRACAKACTEPLGVDALGKLGIRDFNYLRNTVRGFLSRRG